MRRSRKSLLLSAATLLALGVAVGSAEAQGALTNGPDGIQPNTLGRSNPHTTRRPVRSHVLTVRRHRAMEPVVAVVPPPEPVGPGAIVGAPIRAASHIVALPFRIAGGIFPAEGDPAVNPLVLVGGPIRAAGDIAQIPFRIIGAPFGNPGPVLF